jgi:hypothetical protein
VDVSIADMVRAVETDRDTLAALNDMLARRLAELEDDERDAARKHRELLRQTYRRGYLAGRSAQRRGALHVTNPEVNARGWLREALA